MQTAKVKPEISFADLKRIDVRVGTILGVDDVPHSDKLVSLKVDLGDHTRIVLVGMKLERDDPTELVGRQALFVVNLAPRTMAGITSEAMIFDIGYEDGLTPVLAVPDEPVPPGSRVG